jgi:hypothetical protein
MSALGPIALGLSLLQGVAHAQSLGEVARREQEKKKDKAGVSAPAYTDADLKAARGKSKGSVTQLPGPDPASAAASTASPPPAPEPDRGLLERQWRARFAEARARVAAADARAWEERVEVVFVSGIPVQQLVRVKVETEELRQARQALADLEEELRRSGGLPGWGRE